MSNQQLVYNAGGWFLRRHEKWENNGLIRAALAQSQHVTSLGLYLCASCMWLEALRRHCWVSWDEVTFFPSEVLYTISVGSIENDYACSSAAFPRFSFFSFLAQPSSNVCTPGWPSIFCQIFSIFWLNGRRPRSTLDRCVENKKKQGTRLVGRQFYIWWCERRVTRALLTFRILWINQHIFNDSNDVEILGEIFVSSQKRKHLSPTTSP